MEKPGDSQWASRTHLTLLGVLQSRLREILEVQVCEHYEEVMGTLAQQTEQREAYEGTPRSIRMSTEQNVEQEEGLMELRSKHKCLCGVLFVPQQRV